MVMEHLSSHLYPRITMLNEYNMDTFIGYRCYIGYGLFYGINIALYLEIFLLLSLFIKKRFISFGMHISSDNSHPHLHSIHLNTVIKSGEFALFPSPFAQHGRPSVTETAAADGLYPVADR